MNSLSSWPIARTVILLFLSNCFMTVAWYGHLKFRGTALLTAIIASWLLALPEYALQVPANRLGYGTLTAYQLKILQESITLVVFIIFAWVSLGEKLQFRHAVSFLLILTAIVIGFKK
jgi:uncharacterized protein (DUF486 family)